MHKYDLKFDQVFTQILKLCKVNQNKDMTKNTLIHLLIVDNDFIFSSYVWQKYVKL